MDGKSNETDEIKTKMALFEPDDEQIDEKKKKSKKRYIFIELFNKHIFGPLRIFLHNIIMNISYYCSSYSSNMTQFIYFIFFLHHLKN